jgi:serine phosphatase RsbU (regulator of sigma subunit)
MVIRLAVLLIVLPAAVLGQGFHPPVTNYSPRNYGKNHNAENWCVTQDQRGIIYSGNSNGVLEFDGTTWRFIPVKEGAYVTALFTSSSGRVFVGSMGEFGELVSDKLGNLSYLSIYPGKDTADVRLFGAVWRIHEAGGHIVFQSEELMGVMGTQKDAPVALLSPETSFHLSHVLNDQVYVREREKGILRLDLAKAPRIVPVPGTDMFAALGLFGIIPATGDSLLLVTHDQGLYRCSINFSGIEPYHTAGDSLLHHALVYAVIPMKHGEYGLVTGRKGLLVVNNRGRIVHTIDKAGGLRVSEVKWAFQDREQNLWLALQNGIAHVNYYSPLSYFDEEAGITGDVQAITRYHAKIFVGTSSGLYTENPKREREGREFTQLDRVPWQVWDMAVVDDALMLATSDGLVSLTESSVRMVWRGNCNTLVWMPDVRELMVVGNQGLFVLEPGTWAVKTSLEAPNNGAIRSVVSPKPLLGEKEVWTGMFNEGVIRANRVAGTWQIDMYDSFDGLREGAYVRPGVVDNHVVFGSAGSSLQFIDEEQVKAGLPDSLKDNPAFYRGYFDVYDADGSLPHTTTSLISSTAARIWVVQDNQLAYVDRKNGNKLVKHPFWGINFGRFNTFFLEGDDVLWCGTSDGLIRFQENAIKKYNLAFNTLIRRISNNDGIVYGGGGDGLAKNTEPIPYKLNSMVFEFSAPYFEDNHRIQYQWILEGYDDDWSEWSHEVKVLYTNLPEGDYTFRVKARNVYMTESTEASWSFSISPPWYRSTWAYVGYGAGLLLLIFLAARLSSARLRAKNIRLERLVSERTAEIAAKNTVLEKQKDEILHQKTEIEDSINYARRIQEAILPIRQEIEENLPDSFVLFRPKDIVSGDFYWFARIGTRKVLVCADCTGHGVPGAFMSMIGSAKLNQAVKQQGLTNPSEILTDINRGIKESLKQDEDKQTTRDGMDAAILCFTEGSADVLYAGANRPLWLIRNGELMEYVPTKSAVAGFTADDQVYELHTITTQPGDCLYTTTDGYADQFGGEGGKKLKVKVLKDILLQIHQMPMSLQADELERRFGDWKGTFEQLDDVCVIGVRI